MASDIAFEDQVQARARALARVAGLNPDAIVEMGDPEPIPEDRGDGIDVMQMRRPLRPQWAAFVEAARKSLQADASPASPSGEAGMNGSTA